MKAFNENLTPAQLNEYRLKMLSAQLLYAAEHSPFYNELLCGLDLPLTDINQLQSLPFTSADDIRSRGFALSCLPQREIKRIVTLKTSGTTGSSKRILFTAGDIERTVEFFCLGMQYMCSAGDTVGIFMPGLTDDGIGDQLARGLRRMGAVPMIYGAVADIADAVAFLKSTNFHTLVGIPSQMRALALACPELRPKNVLLSADYVAQSVKNTISRLWHTECFEHYGLTETCYGCAVECPEHTGMHIRNDEFIIEIAAPDGSVLPDGQHGEIVITSLRRQAMPLIRYRTGDMGRILSGPCRCGCCLPRLDHVSGRISELNRRPNIHSLDEALLGIDGVGDYTARLEDSVLTIYVNGNESCYSTVKDAVCTLYPEFTCVVNSGEMFKTNGTLKRKLSIK